MIITDIVERLSSDAIKYSGVSEKKIIIAVYSESIPLEANKKIPDFLK